MKNTTTCICEICNSQFERPTKEYTRSLKLNRKSYCSRHCNGVARAQNNNFGGKPNKIPPKIRGTRIADPFKYYLNSCNSRDFEVTITTNYLKDLWGKQEGKCAYLHIPLILSNYSRKKVDMRYSASLDRIDSTKGYIEGNVQFISRVINFMKNTMTHDQTVEFLQTIAQSIINQQPMVEVCGIEPRVTC